MIYRCEEVGLILNVSKTKYTSSRYIENLNMEEMEIEWVKEYTYLGSIVSFTQGLNKE